MSQKDEWIDISKSKSIDEVRNTKEYKDWVKSIKESDNECCVYAGPTSTWKHIMSSRLRILYRCVLSRKTA